MHRRIESPRPLFEAEPRQHLLEEVLLRRDRIVAVEEGVVCGLAGLAHDRRQLRAEHVEDRAYLRRLHPRLVLVEEGVVGRVARLLALGPAQRDAVHPPERREEDRKIGGRPRLQPRRLRLRALAQPGGGELGRDAPRLVPVTTHDSQQARVVGVVLEPIRQRLRALEQPSELVVDEALVDDSAQRRERLRARRSAERRHRRPLIPVEHAQRLLEIVDLGQALLQLGESLVHRPSTYR
ncbi:MAG: hypothetical protein WKF41_07535 [Gaiellaceae bacterium]